MGRLDAAVLSKLRSEVRFMKHYTTIYRLSRLEEARVFDSEKAAYEFLGVKPCGVSSCYLKGKECRGWKIE